MTNQNNQGPNDQGKGKPGTVGDRMHSAPETRSTSLREALAALGESGDETVPAGEAIAGVESNMTDKEKQPSLGGALGKEVQPAPSAGAGAGNPKTKVFGGSSEELKYYQEPVVGWLVVVGGPGIGAHRPIFMGSNTIGSDSGQRIPIDFGDDYISKEEQAYIRYDADDRQFLFIPNLAKTNVVSIDNVKPTSAVRLMPYDIISMGDTQLVFIPFCGDEFDWSDLPVHQK